MARMFFSLKLWEATSSIPVMKMLAEQVETNITRTLIDADQPGAVTEGVLEEDVQDEDGKWHAFPVPYFTCGSCSGYDAEDVKSRYKLLISQLSRRSAFLTMFGLFEHRLVGCIDVMNKLSGEVTNKMVMTVDDCHKRFIGTIGDKSILDIDHLTVIRNIMAHNDGAAIDYHDLIKPNVKTSESQKRKIKALRRATKEKSGISINESNLVHMDDGFLDYAVGEFERYVSQVDSAIRQYQKQISNEGFGT